jgi:hypothetical protein
MTRASCLLAAVAAAAVLSACGSALPGVLDALPQEVAGHEIAERSLAEDARLAAALEAENVAADVVTGSEIRWGDDIRLIAFRFEAVGLNEPRRAALSLLGIGDAESRIAIVANQGLFELTGPEIDGVAYNFTLSGDGGESLMYTIVAPSVADAEPIVSAISEANPRSD